MVSSFLVEGQEALLLAFFLFGTRNAFFIYFFQVAPFSGPGHPAQDEERDFEALRSWVQRRAPPTYFFLRLIGFFLIYHLLF